MSEKGTGGIKRHVCGKGGCNIYLCHYPEGCSNVDIKICFKAVPGVSIGDFCWKKSSLLSQVKGGYSSSELSAPAEGRMLFICLLQLYCTGLGSSGPWKLKMVHSKAQGQTQRSMPSLPLDLYCWMMCLLPCWKATPHPAVIINSGSQLDRL